MKEFITGVWVAIGTMLGIDQGQEEHTKPKQETHQIQQVEQQKETPPTVAAESPTESEADVTSSQEQEEQKPAKKESKEKKPKVVNDGQFNYDVPKDAPWWSPVTGSSTISENVEKGEEGQVSTIWGNGSQGQTDLSMDHPRDLQVDKKGRVWFVDGNQHSAKLRIFDGTKNNTVVDLANNKIARRDGYFLSTGLSIIHDNVYISSISDLYQVKDGRITQLTPKIKAYMKKKNLSDIYRTEHYKDYVYFMFVNKSQQYHIARYNINGGAVEEIIPTKPMPSPYNFYVNGEKEIFIATTNGYVIWEKLFPRETVTAWEAGDPQTEVTDVWIGSNDSMYFAQTEDQSRSVVYENPVGVNADDVVPIIGDRRGFTDGFNDEVEMDYPLDFVWDGTGYVFADQGNNAIRKYWTNVGPMEK